MASIFNIQKFSYIRKMDSGGFAVVLPKLLREEYKIIPGDKVIFTIIDNKFGKKNVLSESCNINNVSIDEDDNVVLEVPDSDVSLAIQDGAIEIGKIYDYRISVFSESDVVEDIETKFYNECFNITNELFVLGDTATHTALLFYSGGYYHGPDWETNPSGSVPFYFLGTKNIVIDSALLKREDVTRYGYDYVTQSIDGIDYIVFQTINGDYSIPSQKDGHWTFEIPEKSIGAVGVQYKATINPQSAWKYNLKFGWVNPSSANVKVYSSDSFLWKANGEDSVCHWSAGYNYFRREFENYWEYSSSILQNALTYGEQSYVAVSEYGLAYEKQGTLDTFHSPYLKSLQNSQVLGFNFIQDGFYDFYSVCGLLLTGVKHGDGDMVETPWATGYICPSETDICTMIKDVWSPQFEARTNSIIQDGDTLFLTTLLECRKYAGIDVKLYDDYTTPSDLIEITRYISGFQPPNQYISFPYSFDWKWGSGMSFVGQNLNDIGVASGALCGVLLTDEEINGHVLVYGGLTTNDTYKSKVVPESMYDDIYTTQNDDFYFLTSYSERHINCDDYFENFAKPHYFGFDGMPSNSTGKVQMEPFWVSGRSFNFKIETLSSEKTFRISDAFFMGNNNGNAFWVNFSGRTHLYSWVFAVEGETYLGEIYFDSQEIHSLGTSLKGLIVGESTPYNGTNITFRTDYSMFSVSIGPWWFPIRNYAYVAFGFHPKSKSGLSVIKFDFNDLDDSSYVDIYNIGDTIQFLYGDSVVHLNQGSLISKSGSHVYHDTLLNGGRFLKEIHFRNVVDGTFLFSADYGICNDVSTLEKVDLRSCNMEICNGIGFYGTAYFPKLKYLALGTHPVGSIHTNYVYTKENFPSIEMISMANSSSDFFYVVSSSNGVDIGYTPWIKLPEIPSARYYMRGDGKVLWYEYNSEEPDYSWRRTDGVNNLSVFDWNFN